MRLVKLLLCILLPLLSLAQVNPLFLEPTKGQADSLLKALQQDINDTLRMAANRELALYYLDINSDSALFYIEKGLPLAKKLQLKLWEADALDLIGIITSNQGNYVKSIKSINEAIEIVNDKECLKNIWRISKFTNSNLPENARLSLLGTIYSDVAGIYGETGNKDKQVNSINECIAIAEQLKDNTLFSQAYRNLGSKYFFDSMLDSALFYLQKSLDFSDLAGYKKYRGNTYNLISRIYLQQNLYGPALENILHALNSGREQNNNPGIARSYVLLSSYYNKTGKNDSALYYAKLGLTTSLSTGQTSDMIEGYRSLVEIYKDLDRPDSALVYLELAHAASDSLLGLEKIKQLQNIGFDEELRLQELEKERVQTKSRIRTYSLVAGLGILLIIAGLLYRNNTQKQRTNRALEISLARLKATQSQLVQSEKMASLGELTAGIAHEIQNPLNFVNNFSEVSSELLEEMKEQWAIGNGQQAIEIANDVKQNLEKILHHGKRADSIVKGMLQHSQTSSRQKELTDINNLADEYLRLAFHGLRAKDKSFNADLKTDFDDRIDKIEIVPQEIGQVLVNLLNNAFYAVNERRKKGEKGYEPMVTVYTKRLDDRIELGVSDNGIGIPDEAREKIFQPFFTSKPTGEGTGLGLSLSYDIVKAHGGEVKVNTESGKGSEFIISLPA